MKFYTEHDFKTARTINSINACLVAILKTVSYFGTVDKETHAQ